jgi:hypothetical protein
MPLVSTLARIMPTELCDCESWLDTGYVLLAKSDLDLYLIFCDSTIADRVKIFWHNRQSKITKRNILGCS